MMPQQQKDKFLRILIDCYELNLSDEAAFKKFIDCACDLFRILETISRHYGEIIEQMIIDGAGASKTAKSEQERIDLERIVRVLSQL